MSEHPRLPLKIITLAIGFRIEDAYGIGVARVGTRQDAEVIVRAINAHEELVKALTCFLDDERFQVAVGGNPIVVDRMLDEARAALAKARA